MRIAIYARVSKDEGEGQNPENQLVALRKMAEALGGEVVSEYVDFASGGSANRPKFQQILEDVRARKLDLILVWALDRFSREGIRSTLSYLETLRNHKVALRSLQEPWLDTSDEGMGQLLIAIFSWMAQQERKRISERTKAGLKGKVGIGKRGKDKKPRRTAGYNLRYAKQRGSVK